MHQQHHQQQQQQQHHQQQQQPQNHAQNDKDQHMEHSSNSSEQIEPSRILEHSMATAEVYYYFRFFNLIILMYIFYF